jgi:hypothetical protein
MYATSGKELLSGSGMVNADEPLSDSDSQGGGGAPVIKKRRRRRQASAGESEQGEPQRKRVGRPLAYSGDPEAPELSDRERRKIKR